MNKNYEAIIVGSGYGGVICGAILAKEGVKTLVVDGLDCIGGRQAAIELPNHPGYYNHLGHRDSHDTSDFCEVESKGLYHGQEAERRVGITIPREPSIPAVRAHLLPEERAVSLHLDDPAKLAEYLALPGDKLNAFVETYLKIAMLDDQEMMSVSIGEWLQENVPDKDVRNAFYYLAIAIYIHPPESLSVGRLGQMARHSLEIWLPTEYRALEGLITPYEKVIRENGGDIRTGLKTTEITVQDSRITGIVTQDISGCVEVFEAPVVVSNLELSDAIDVINPADSIPEEMIEIAEGLDKYWGDVIFILGGLSRVPTIRKENKVDDFIGWNRVQGGKERKYMGGWYIPTLSSPLMAPEGKHQIMLGYGNRNLGKFESFKYAKEKVDETFNYLLEYYADLDECLEWKEYFLHRNRVFSLCGIMSGIPLAPMKAPKIDGLYFVGSSVAVPGGSVGSHDCAAKSALDVADMILEGSSK